MSFSSFNVQSLQLNCRRILVGQLSEWLCWATVSLWAVGGPAEVPAHLAATPSWKHKQIHWSVYSYTHFSMHFLSLLFFFLISEVFKLVGGLQHIWTFFPSLRWAPLWNPLIYTKDKHICKWSQDQTVWIQTPSLKVRVLWCIISQVHMHFKV